MSHPIADPFAQREAEKYDKPIPSREYIMAYLAERGRPATRDRIAADLDLSTDDQLEALRRRLKAMERDGQLLSNRRGGYGLIDKMNLLKGRVIGHKEGFGFVVPEDGSGDLFLTARQMRSVFDGDSVLVRIVNIDHRGRREAAIVEVLEHATTQVVGRFVVEAGIGFVIPNNKRITQTILIPSANTLTAQSGQIVIAAIISPPSQYQQAIGEIIEILGDHMAPGMEIDIAIRAHDLPYVWPLEVQQAVASLKAEVPEAAKQGRTDLRHLPLVTIDGEDAKDFDDAVYCQPKPRGGWQLYVAIADVSHYVTPFSALDQEAQKRGNSVYFPGKVIPMLPEILSNGLCSLKPHTDRLCMVCEMSITAQGKISRYQFYPAVMHSHARLTYTEVAAALADDKQQLSFQITELLPHLQALQAVYHALRAQRELRGAIDFETIETRIIFGSERKIAKIIPAERNEAHRLIEECMLAANVATARLLLKHEIPSLYRVHAGPTPEKLLNVRQFLAELNLSLRGADKPTPGDYAALLQTIRGRPDAHLIQTVLLRSLSQAIYTPDNNGHFGLAYQAYTHFTSPIRRYPDLLVHRAISHILSEQPIKAFHYDKAKMQQLGEQCSLTERRADEAVRDTVGWLKCEFMLDRIGEIYTGIISSVTSFGLFVELQDIYVEGLVHVTALNNDYYQFDPVHHRLRGERTGTTYRLGDTLQVQVTRVDLEQKRIDFELVASLTESAANKRRKKSTAIKPKSKSIKAVNKKTKSPANKTKSVTKKSSSHAKGNAKVERKQKLLTKAMQALTKAKAKTKAKTKAKPLTQKGKA